MKKLITLLIIFLLSLSLVLANGSHENEIEKGKSLVESKADCSKLADEDLEAIGEYLMEQMHHHEQHDLMHERMGLEEGTEEHKQLHVRLAEMMYCGNAVGSGMMNMMGGRNMMGNFGGMMSTNPALMWFWSLLAFLLLLGLVVLVWVLVVKYWKEASRRK